jgi:putative FmdB family regulatory protein
MPTYEYQCQKCGHCFSEFQRIVDPPIKDCPKCKRKGCVEQVISGGSGLIFKGSGFYETDYKRKSSGGGGTTAGSDSTKPTNTKKN